MPAATLDKQTSLASLDEILASVCAAIAPVWPLKDYVAVNPFMGLTTHRFLEARQTLRELRDGDILMPLSYYRQKLEQGLVERRDLELALEQCQSEYGSSFARATVDDLLEFVASAPQWKPSESDRRVWTVAESADRLHGTTWARSVVHEISRHCAAHYDEGQATWSSPWKHLSLYDAWRRTALVDRRFELLGVAGFRTFVATLPTSPRDAIIQMLEFLNIPRDAWSQFLCCQIYSIYGWAAYATYRVREQITSEENDDTDDLLGLLAIRLAYDGGLMSAGLAPSMVADIPLSGTDDLLPDVEGMTFHASDQTLIRYWLQVATELAYRRSLCESLSSTPQTSIGSARRPEVQMVFCIDVRSEVIRRHLESVSPSMETWGFAGFFGLPIEYFSLGESTGQAQCPVLLRPSLRIAEGLHDASPEAQTAAIHRRHQTRIRRSIWKTFQRSAASGFSFVEAVGLTYLLRLIADTFYRRHLGSSSHFDGVHAGDCDRLGPVLDRQEETGLSIPQQIELAAAILKNLGLTHDFAPMVVLCGHSSDTVNNPYRAGLDCGACGGHSGESNARVAAMILNQAEVRLGLERMGIRIPNETWFVPAVHHTTSDEIEFFDLRTLPQSLHGTLERLQGWARDAGELTRGERALRMGTTDSKRLQQRCTDWSEVRPEWGLAGNAAFIIAPRTRTKSIPLNGRTFLHNYDHHLDVEGKVLETIMTAPMIVTTWINLQYYASTVDNRHYGSGNKVLHNVVGQFGIFEGNGGDLMTGLPWQSVHDGQNFQHEPLRLLVMIEAPRTSIGRILNAHPSVRDLVCNGWISITAIEDGQYYRYTAHGKWQS